MAVIIDTNAARERSESSWAVRMLWVVLTVTLAASSPATLDAQDNTVADWQRPGAVCEPSCRSGYECQRGECRPVCSPRCAQGFLCSAGGACVRAEPVATPAPIRTVDPNTCSPTCRNGYECHAGACVSQCNPICAVGERCTAQGECLPANASFEPEPAYSQAPTPAPTERDSAADAIVALHVDVLGALQFGLTPTVEIGEVFSGFFRLRLLDTGLASQFLLGRNADADLRRGVGAALGIHLFSSERGNMRGFYGGLALEYAYIETRDNTRDFVTFHTHALIPQLDLGYRWAFGQLLVGLSARLGVAIPVSNQASALGDNGCRLADSCTEKYSVAFIPGIALDLGGFIPRQFD